ncbi:three-helix bundle dimerization domain-containing protein [Streptomyces sp. LN245]|uniref:three-helix bundle dimerization domain-containing protein n=1 Tax=Streptomyces sp. LN245 TaxID=3112975 RepID=UPI003713324B
MGANTAEAAVPDPIQELTDRLTASYSHLLTAAIVRDVVQDCYQPLSNARIPNYVPILVEHSSRTKLRQLTRRSDPTVLLREHSDGIRGHFITRAWRRVRVALTRSA